MTVQPGPPQIPPFDPGVAGQLAELPALFMCTVIQTGNGPRLFVTMRVGTATVTAILRRDDAKAWAASMNTEADRVSPIAVVGPGAVPLNLHQP